MIYSGDEYYDESITSGLLPEERHEQPYEAPCSEDRRWEIAQEAYQRAMEGADQHAAEDASEYAAITQVRAQARFTLGQLVATPGALAALVTAGESPTPYLTRHLAGDFGAMDAEDSALNRADIRRGNGRVFSAYLLADGTKIWVITNLIDGYGYDTCVLLPSEY